MNKLFISLSLLFLTFSHMSCMTIPWKHLPKLTKLNYKKKQYGYKKKMYLPECYQGDYTNEEKYMSTIKKYYKSYQSKPKFPLSNQSYEDSGYGKNVVKKHEKKNAKYGSQKKYGILMPMDKYLGSISKYVNQKSYNSYVSKMNQGNKHGMSNYNMYNGKQCAYNNYQYSHMCGKYGYCCYWNSSKHMYYYLYKMYYYAKAKYGCEKAKIYSTRLGYKMMNNSPYWYQKYNWDKIPEVVYSYKC